MKIDDIPQDESALKNFTNEVCYAKNKDGKYETALSKGWSIKKEALDEAWIDIEEQKQQAISDFKSGKLSPLYYYMVNGLMDVKLLSQYSGFWQFTIKRHFKPTVFNRLSDTKLKKYADLFKITIKELKNPNF